MARGPKPDPNQAAKGFPGRRKAKAKEAAAAAAHLVKLLAPGSSLTDLPAILADKKYAPAAAVWRRLAPELRRTWRLPVEAEYGLVQFCIYWQEWVSATEDLHTNGFTQDVQTVAGDVMERRRPKTFDRQQAFSNIGELSVKFGLTPNDMYSLFKDQARVAETNPGLFGEGRKNDAPEPAAEADAPPAVASRIGGLSARRSAPPPESLN